MAVFHFFWRSKSPDVPRAAVKLQKLVYHLDVGVGLKILKVLSFVLFAMLLMVWYAASQFVGLKQPEAMDMAQVGRNMAQGKGFVTSVLRPFSIRYLETRAADRNPRLENHPELFRAPVYPWLLSKVFSMTRKSGAEADKIVMRFSLVWVLPSLLLVYLLALQWFDKRAALLSVWVYLLSNTVFAWGISGTPMSFLAFLLLTAVYFLVLAARRHEMEGAGPVLKILFLVFSALSLAIGALTRYAFGLWIVPVVVYLCLVFKRRWVGYVALYLVVFPVPVAAWMMHQMRVCGKPLGLAHYALVQGSYFLPGDQLMRRYQDEAISQKIARSIKPRQFAAKVVTNVATSFDTHLRRIGDNLIVVFFVASFLHPFRRRDVSQALRCVIIALGLAVLVCGLTDSSAGGLLDVFFPIAVIFGCAFFWVLFERLALSNRLKRALLTGAFVAVNSVPLFLVLLPPSPPKPYPPVRPEWIQQFNRWFRPEEQVASDIPWAVAWYADRRAVLTPWTLKEFFMLRDGVVIRMNGLYLTQASLTDYTPESDFGEIRFAPSDWPLDMERPWAAMAMGIPIALRSKYPGGFPLSRVLPFDFANLLYADIERWRVGEPSR